MLGYCINLTIIYCVARTTGNLKRKKTNIPGTSQCTLKVYDYKEKTARVVFGAKPVMLRLHSTEPFQQQPNVIKALCLLLGPDFYTDIIAIETADRASLQLQPSYNWWVLCRIKLCGGQLTVIKMSKIYTHV